MPRAIHFSPNTTTFRHSSSNTSSLLGRFNPRRTPSRPPTATNALLLRYTFAAFCGLVPLPLILFLANTKRSSLLPAGKFLPKSRSDGDGGSTVLERYSSTASTASLGSTASARSSKDHGSHEGDEKDSATTSRATKKGKLKPAAAATARSLPVRIEIL